MKKPPPARARGGSDKPGTGGGKPLARYVSRDAARPSTGDLTGA